MLLMLTAVFWLTIVGANYPSDCLSRLFMSFQGVLSGFFEKIGAPEWLHGIEMCIRDRVIAARVRHLQIEDYIAYMLIDILFGAVSLILLLTGVVGSVIPSVICIALSAVFLSALLIFHGNSLMSEISRRMHM